MQKYEPLSALPVDIQLDWLASLQQATPTKQGVFRLVAIRRTDGQSYEGQRITVLVVDENGFPLPNVLVAFSYSTAKQYLITPDFLWNPPPPPRAFIIPTEGSGQCDQVQGDVVKAGQPGGITVYLLEPQYSSDAVSGLGMLANHDGLHLTFQLRRTGVMPLMERINDLDNRIAALELRAAQNDDKG